MCSVGVMIKFLAIFIVGWTSPHHYTLYLDVSCQQTNLGPHVNSVFDLPKMTEFQFICAEKRQDTILFAVVVLDKFACHFFAFDVGRLSFRIESNAKKCLDVMNSIFFTFSQHVWYVWDFLTDPISKIKKQQ